MAHRTRCIVAALSLAACSGTSTLERGSRPSSGGSAGRSGTSGGSAATTGAGTGHTVTAGGGTARNEPVMLPVPEASDPAAPKAESEPLLLARHQLEPTALALDAENVYWLNRGTFEAGLKDQFSNGDASVMK